MADPWALTIATLAFLGQAPNFLENWEKLMKKLRDHQDLSEPEIKESEVTLLEARADWLAHKVMLLDLVLAFSKEHTMNPKLTEYCELQRPCVFEEFKSVKERISKLATAKKG
jgi:hypothetical protein